MYFFVSSVVFSCKYIVLYVVCSRIFQPVVRITLDICLQHFLILCVHSKHLHGLQFLVNDLKYKIGKYLMYIVIRQSIPGFLVRF